MSLESEAYRFLIHGREVARGKVQLNQWLAIGTHDAPPPLEGDVVAEPAFGIPSKWIAEHQMARAELLGLTVVDAPGVMVTHLGEILRRHAAELLGREDLKILVDKVRATSPSVVDELIPNIINMGTLHRVLSLLLDEHVPISNLTRIMESLSTHAPTVKDPGDLAERVRGDLGRILCDRFRDANSRFSALVFDPRVEMEFACALHDRQLATSNRPRPGKVDRPPQQRMAARDLRRQGDRPPHRHDAAASPAANAGPVAAGAGGHRVPGSPDRLHLAAGRSHQVGRPQLTMTSGMQRMRDEG